MIYTNEITRKVFITLTWLIFTITECSARALPSISPQEYKHIVWHELEDNEESKKRCEYGEYWSFVTRNCKECERDCPNGTNMQTNCGYDCRNYFLFEAQKEELREYKAETDQKFAENLRTQTVLIVLITLTLLAMIVYGIYRCCSSRRKTKAFQKTTTGVRSNQQETLNSDGNQNSQVNLNVMMTTVMANSEGSGAVPPGNDNRQDGVLENSAKIRENGNNRNSATAFIEDNTMDSQQSTSDGTIVEQANADNKALPFDTYTKEDEKRDASRAMSSSIQPSDAFVQSATVRETNINSSSDVDQTPEVNASSTTAIKNGIQEHEETTPLTQNTEDDPDDPTNTTLQEDLNERNRRKAMNQRPQRRRKRSSS